jgi:hypothetical protein
MSPLDQKLASLAKQQGMTVDELKMLRRATDTMGARNALVDDGEIELLLETYSLVMVGGAARVARWFPSGELQLLRMDAFKALFANRARIVGQGELAKRVPLARYMLDHMRRYCQLVFKPGEDVASHEFNLWRGFAVEPAFGNWSLLAAHITDVLANGDKELGDYILKWLAWAVQNPGKRAEVALVFRGRKGVGKGLLGNVLRLIFGASYVHVSNRKHLTSGFNMHLARCSLLFADEAYWPGDKAGEGELKRLITEPTLMIEPKGVDPFAVANGLHVIIVGNEDWMVPASGDERRYAVAAVSDAHQGDAAYFNALFDEINNDGAAAMLFDLLELDLKGWHPRSNVPQTVELREQQAQSLRGIDALVVELAHEAQLPCSTFGRPHVAVTSGEERGEGFWCYTKKTFPDLRYLHTRIIMAGLRRYGCKPSGRGSGARGVAFPPLGELRATIDRKLWPQDWDEQTDWEAANAY